MMIRPAKALMVTMLIACASISAMAQSYKGSVQANFTTEDGSPLPGVTVTLSASTFSRSFVTDNNGNVRFVGLTPGTYELRGVFTGFNTVVRPNIKVDTGANVKLEFNMVPAAQAEEMVIVAETPIADSDKVGTATVLTTEELELLPQARDPWAVLDTIPGIQTDRVNIGGNESGQQSIFVGKGDDGDNAAWIIDGVEFTDHAAEGASQSYLDFGAFDQIGFTTGGSNVSSGASGTTMNFVTKQGTNEHHGSMRLLFADQDFQSKNLPAGVAGNRIVETFEKGFEIGGPIIKDRFWYWGAFSQNTIDNLVVSGSNDRTRLENLSFKLHGNVTSTTRVTAFYTNGDKQKEGRGAGNSRAPETTWNQQGPTPIYKFEVSQLIGQNTEIQFIYGRVDGGFQLSPVVSPDTAQPVFNEVLGRWENSYRDLDFSRPSRQYELKGDTYLAIGNSEHEFNYGFKYKNAWSIAKESWGAGGSNLWVDDYSGLGSTSYFRAHRDRFAGTELDTTSFWVKDTMTFGNLTLEAGLRYNVSDASNLPSTSVAANPLFPDAVPGLAYQGDDAQFEYKTVSPQIGATYTFGEDNQFLVRGSYRQYYDDISVSEAGTTNAAGRSWVTGYAEDKNGDGQYDANELGFALDANGSVIPYRGNEASQDPYGFGTVGINRNDPTSATSQNTIDPNLEPPEVDEIIVGGEWSITPGFSVSAAYTIRERSNTTWSLTQLGNGRLLNRSDYVLQHTLTGTNPESGERYNVDYYVISGEADALSRQFGGSYLTNRPDYSEDFKGFEVTATKRLSNKWMLRGYIALNDWTRNIGANGITNPTPDATRSNVDGSDVAIASGGSGDKGDVFAGTASWTSSLNGLYQLPWDMAISGVVTYREGYQAPLFNNASGFVNAQTGRAANQNFSIGPLDALRYDDLLNVNLKLSKVFKMGSTKVDLAVEVFNVFNEDTILQLNRNYGIQRNDGGQTQEFNTADVRSTYRRVDEYLSPRVARFSATINF